jgi:hypothetical protein
VTQRDIREVLAQELGRTATWRRESAAEHPREHTHAHSAVALEQLIDYIRALPPDDSRLRRLDELNRDPEFFLLGGDEARTLIDQYGVEAMLAGDVENACDVFLTRLIMAARIDESDVEGRQAPPSG